MSFFFTLLLQIYFQKIKLAFFAYLNNVGVITLQNDISRKVFYNEGRRN